MNRILIIEDDISINKILSHELKNKDYQVDSLYDGKEACQKILSNEYDLVLVDWMLPYKDGVDTGCCCSPAFATPAAASEGTVCALPCRAFFFQMLSL